MARDGTALISESSPKNKAKPVPNPENFRLEKAARMVIGF